MGTGAPIASAELYDPTAGTFSCIGGSTLGACNSVMSAGRTGSSATMLNDGRILFAGGISGSAATGYTAIGSAENHDPMQTSSPRPATCSPLARAIRRFC